MMRTTALAPVLMLVCLPLLPGPADVINRTRRDQEQIRLEFEKQKGLITAEFGAVARELGLRRSGVTLSMPVAVERVSNVISHRSTPDQPTPKRIFAFVAQSFELRSEPVRTLEGGGMVEVRPGQRVEVVLMLKEAVREQRDPSFRWCMVRTADDEEGYIPNTYLRAEAQPETPQTKPGFKYISERGGVAVRQRAAADGKLVARLQHRTEVQVIRYDAFRDTIDGISDLWAFVRYKEIEGWIFNGYLREKKPEKPIIPTDTRPFLMPTDGGRTSDYGPRVDPLTKKSGVFHTGVDIAAPSGTPILSALDGTVKLAERQGGYGLLIVVEHDDELSTYYGHQSRFAVKPGARVTRGQLIGYVGSTGRSTGPHLHFEVRVGSAIKNPDDYLPQ